MAIIGSIHVIDVFWATGTLGTCGIVYGRDTITGEAKAYLGIANEFDEEKDTENIVRFGAKINPKVATLLMGIEQAPPIATEQEKTKEEP